MFIRKPKLLLDKAGVNGSASGYDQSNTAPPAQAQANGNNSPAAAAVIPTPQGAQNAQAPAAVEPQQATPPIQPPTQAVIPDITGYSTKPVEPAVVPDPKAKPAEEPPVAGLELKIDFKGLDPEKNKDLVDFAKSQGLNQNQAQAIMDMRKAAIDNQAKLESDFEASKVETFKKWETELREDKDFGGANFDNSIHMVNSFVTNHIPELTKALTGNGGRLSSSEMKEIRALALKMNNEGNFEQGNASSSKDKPHNPTSYYTN